MCTQWFIALYYEDYIYMQSFGSPLGYLNSGSLDLDIYSAALS